MSYSNNILESLNYHMINNIKYLSILLWMLSELSYAIDINYQDTIDKQNRITIQLNNNGDSLLNIQGYGAEKLSSIEEQLVDSTLIGWKQVYEQDKVLLTVHEGINSVSHFQMLPLDTLSSNLTLQYGSQNKQINIKQIALLVKIKPLDPNNNISVTFSNECIFWQKNYAYYTEALIKPNCTNTSFTINDFGNPWQQVATASYYGIETNKLASLQGGHWSLSTTTNSNSSTMGVNSITTQNNVDTHITNGSYRFQFDSGGIVVSIPFSSNFYFQNNQSKSLNVTLIPDPSNVNNYMSDHNEKIILTYTTNQSITGLKYRLICDEQVQHDNQSYCALKNLNLTTVTIPLKVFLSECNDSSAEFCHAENQFMPMNTIDIPTDKNINYAQLRFLASNLATKPDGHYQALVKIMADAQF